MIQLYQALILSIIQAITEWLPVSSSGHLAIFEAIFGIKDFSFAVFLHFSSILAVIIIFWKDIFKLLDFRNKENLKYIFYLIIAIIPAGIIGYFFKDNIEKLFSSMFYLGIFFIISGIIIFSTKFFKKRVDGELSLKDSIAMGLFQVFGILPGISRSGSTITGGLFTGANKESVVKFSFLMAIPVILGASLLEIKDIVVSDISIVSLIISFAVCFFVSLISIKLLLKIIRRNNFYLFGIYNFIVGILVLIWSFFR
jgi:undecaprenyl-diphosphatase